ncbi:MAG: hypothetical protein SGARI_004329 [Bacillariaceae sp.]
MLYTVKTIKTIAIAFPFFILLCIPARLYLLPRIFYGYELVVLDGSPEEVESFVREHAIPEGEEEEEEKPLVESEETTKVKDDDDKDDEEAVIAAAEGDDQPTDLPERVPADSVTSSAHTPEMFELARRRSGRVRKKTVSDLSGMFKKNSNETVWDRVI